MQPYEVSEKDSRGGKARLTKMTKKQRVIVARKGGLARWSKKDK